MTGTCTYGGVDTAQSNLEPSWPIEIIASQQNDCERGTELPCGSGTAFRDPSEIYFRMQLESYLALRGPAQRKARELLAKHITQSRNPEKRIRQVLEKVQTAGFESWLQSAIDLLARGGSSVQNFAVNCVFASPQEVQEDAAFVLAAAAARLNKNLIGTVLLLSPSVAMREAAIEFAPELPAKDARSLLKHVAAYDQSEYLKRRAAAILQEIA